MTWTDRLDAAGEPHTSSHSDGTRIGCFYGEFWVYSPDWRWTPPGAPPASSEPQGPFVTIDDAKAAYAAQGIQQPFPFGVAQ